VFLITKSETQTGEIMTKKTIFSVALIIVLLVSCKTFETGTLVEQTENIATASPTPRNATKTPTQTATIEYFATWTKEAEISFNTKIEDILVKCVNFDDAILSPNHKWLAFVCSDTAFSTLVIANNSDQRWVLKFQDFWYKEAIENDYTLDGTLYPLFWSMDETFLYFGPHYAYDPSSACEYAFGISGLYRINVETGEITTILSPLYNWIYSASPDGQWLVISSDKLYLLNRYTWEKYPINLDGNLNSVNWSQDNSKIVFSSCKWIKDKNPWLDISTISLFTIESKTLQRLVINEGRFLDISALGDQLMIEGIGEGNGNNGNNYLYDWSTGKLIEVTPSPQQ
jgi:hypothetical protein